jgi:hypothetical protein
MTSPVVFGIRELLGGITDSAPTEVQLLEKTIEMIRMEEASSMDFLWPSSQVALELYKLTPPARR